ncbi:MAG: TadE/TadG family type IV pilus assembly protein [Acidimicrobiales bacterium]
MAVDRLMTIRRPLEDRERGAVAAEFALLIPVFLILIFGMIELGLAFQRKEVVNAAAREGARIAALPSTTTADACNRVNASLAGTSFTGAPTCAVVGDCAASSPSVVVTVTVTNQLNIPFWGSPNITLTGTGDFRCE